MPIYEYECTCCSSRFEVKQSFNDEPRASCPQCGGRAIRVFFPVPIHFKGSGFYVTDSGGYHSHSSQNSDSDNEGKKVVGTTPGSGEADSSKTDSGEAKKDSTEESS